jgi:ribosomal protein S18 acetylase RimI-like enzyme
VTKIRPVGATDREWIDSLIRDRWGDDVVAVHGATYRPVALAGFAAFEGDEPVGLVTFVVDAGACEIVTIDALRPREAIGSRLIDAVEREARASDCLKLWLVTTNDNEDALAFYAARGFSIVAVRRGAVDASRVLKPSIPLTNARGVAIRDEIELSRDLP